MKKNKCRWVNKWLIAAVLLSLLILWPVLRKGFWESDDGEWMVIRFSAFHQSLRDGHFPVRWTQRLNHDYGYPVMNFLYPLPFYLAEIPKTLGFNFAGSIKAIFAASVIGAAISMFFFAKKWGNLAAYIASLFYIFAPYRIFLLYARGSLGESVALTFAPLLFFFSDRIIKQANWKNIIGLGISYAAIIMSHNVIAILFTPLIIGYLIKATITENKKVLARSFFALMLGFVFSAFFWIPALWELQYTKASGISISNYSSYYLNIKDLFFMTGFISLIFVMIAIAKKEYFFSFSALFTVLFMHPVSNIIIKVFPIIQKIQFPWRVATIFIFSSAVAAAFVVKKFKLLQKNKLISAGIITLVVCFSVLPRFKNIKFTNRNNGFYLTNDDTTTVQNEFTPIWVKVIPQNRPDEPFEIKTTPNSFEIVDQEFKTGWQYLQIRLNEPVQIVFNTHYFPGWKIYLDDEEVKFDPEETSGIIQLRVNPGRNNLRTVKLVFEKTPVRKISELISLTAVLITLFICLLKTVGKQSRTKAVGLLFLSIALANIFYFIVSNLSTYRQIFVESEMEQKYLNSQWVESDFKKAVPIGDSGLYAWAGWEYIHGKNPILINPEMPPLGKYLIGLGLLLTRRPAIVGLIFSTFALVSHFFLGKLILKNNWLAIISSSLLSFEPVFIGLFNATMLDGLQIGFINLALIFFIKGLKNYRLFFISSLMLGAAISTKFFVSTAVLIFSLGAFLVISRNRKKLKIFILTLPVALAIHTLSYFNYFLQGNSLREYLGVQKWIIVFYRQGNVGTVPIGSYWLLVLFNKWRIWFGQEWGKYATIKSNLWRITWPLSFLAAILSTIFFKRLKLSQGHGVLMVWLVVYSIFLTFIIGWPHYMLLFLPYSFILLVELGNKLFPILVKKN